MKLQLTPNKLQELFSKGYSLDHIAILKFIDEGMDISENVKDSSKMAVLHNSLIRKGLIFETENKLTIIGRELILFIDSKDRKRIKKTTASTSEFDAWWSEYPDGDTFEYKGRKFIGSRGFKVKQPECRTLFNTLIIKEGYTADQLMEALKLEVYLKKEKSLKENSNNMRFMQNTHSYLFQRTFDSFIALINKGVKIEETKSNIGGGSTDI